LPGSEVPWSAWSAYPNKRDRDTHFVYDVVGIELHYDPDFHDLALRLQELTESPLLITPAELHQTWDNVVKRVIYQNMVKPYLGIDATGAGMSIYEDMLRYGIKPVGYHLTGGFTESSGKKNVKNIPKLDLFGAMISNFQKGWIRIGNDVPYSDRLKEELLSFRWKDTKVTGQLTVQHDKESDHDDCLTALSCAIQASYDDANHWKRKTLPSGIYSAEQLGLRQV
jgi:hypothetical protein